MTAPPAPALAGLWMVAEAGGRATPAERPPMLRFDDDGRLTGTTGVNRLAGPWALHGGLLTVGPLVMTRKAGPAHRMALEAAVVAVLDGPVAVAPDGAGGVRLGGAGGLLLRPALADGDGAG